MLGDATISELSNTAGKLVSADNTGKLVLVDKSLIGDNLGNHLATQNLDMNGFNVLNADNMTANSYYGRKVLTGQIVGFWQGDDYGKLEIFGSNHADAAKIELCDGHADNWRSAKFLVQGHTSDYQFWIDNAMAFKFNKTLMTVGNSESPINLRVNGKIDANEIEVSLNHWNDYVFHDDYKLMPLLELELFVNANKHLPEIPSENQVIEYGINIGEMNALLLKKIEELTLYVIELKKENDVIKARLDNQGF